MSKTISYDEFCRMKQQGVILFPSDCHTFTEESKSKETEIEKQKFYDYLERKKAKKDLIKEREILTEELKSRELFATNKEGLVRLFSVIYRQFFDYFNIKFFAEDVEMFITKTNPAPTTSEELLLRLKEFLSEASERSFNIFLELQCLMFNLLTPKNEYKAEIPRDFYNAIAYFDTNEYRSDLSNPETYKMYEYLTDYCIELYYQYLRTDGDKLSIKLK